MADSIRWIPKAKTNDEAYLVNNGKVTVPQLQEFILESLASHPQEAQGLVSVCREAGGHLAALLTKGGLITGNGQIIEPFFGVQPANAELRTLLSQSGIYSLKGHQLSQFGISLPFNVEPLEAFYVVEENLGGLLSYQTSRGGSFTYTLARNTDSQRYLYRGLAPMTALQEHVRMVEEIHIASGDISGKRLLGPTTFVEAVLFQEFVHSK